MKKIFAFLFSSAALSAPLMAQSAEDAIRYVQRTPILTARAQGLTGAIRAGLGDGADLYSNPAGLGWISSTQFTGGINVLNGEDNSTYQLGGSGTGTTPTVFSKTGLSNISYLHKYDVARGALVLGIGFQQTGHYNRSMNFAGENGKNSITDYFLPETGQYSYDAGKDGIVGTSDDNAQFSLPISQIAWETYGIDFDKNLYAQNKYPFFAAVQAGRVAQNGTVNEQGGASEMNLAIAWEGVRNVMLGASANFIFGEYDYNRTLTESDKYNDNNGTFPSVDFKGLTLQEELHTGLSGLNLRLGASALVKDNLKIGVTVESPSWIKVTEDYSTYLKTEYDNGDTYEYGGQTGDTGTGTFDYNIKTPWRLGAGAQFGLGNIQVFADAEYVDWSKLELSASSDQAYFEKLNQNISTSYQAVLNLAAGAEAKLGKFAIRGGFGQQKDGRTTPDVRKDKTTFSLGASVDLGERMTLGVSASQDSYQDQYLLYTDLSSFNPTRYNDDPFVSRDLKRQFVVVDLKVKF